MYLTTRPQSRSRAATAVWTSVHTGLGQPAQALATLKFLPLFRHFLNVNGTHVSVIPARFNPGFVNGGTGEVTVTEKLRDCLKVVMATDSNRKFRHIKVALVDLTKGLDRPEYAGSFDHQTQTFVASVAKMPVMLGAFQLREDVRVKRGSASFATVAALFEAMREEWRATQVAGPETLLPLARGLTTKGRLLHVNGRPIPLVGTTMPKLERILTDQGGTIDFVSSGEDLATLEGIVDGFNLDSVKAELTAARTSKDPARIQAAVAGWQAAVKARPAMIAKLKALGFRERLGIAVGGNVPASNFALARVLEDLGFGYVASALLQSGLHNPDRGGGLWLGSDAESVTWRGGVMGGGPTLGGTARSVATLLTLLAQRRLVSSVASREMQDIIQKVGMKVPGTGSWFLEGLRQLPGGGRVVSTLAKVGLAGGSDDCAYIERMATIGGADVRLRYVAVGLRARNGEELRQLIRALDQCIITNNTP